MEKKSNSFLKEWVFPIIAAIAIAFIVNKTLFFTSEVPTTSMHPTIKVGDRIIVTRVYNKDALKRGEIVLFNSEELKMLLVKRLIGLPGDTVEVKTDGSLYINGVKTDEPYVIKKDTKPGSFKVPEDSFLFFGDNRVDSFDSRYWKMPYIQKRDIVGKAQFIIYPFDRIGMFK